jgi:YidC/Oxa1 family membrane protein insertase
MDIQRLIQFFALGFVLLLIWSAWETDYGPQRPAVERDAETREVVAERDPGVPDLFAPGDLASEFTDPADPLRQPAVGAPAVPGEQAPTEVRVRTDLLDVVLSTRGGELQQVDLLEYGVTARDPTPLRFMSTESRQLFTARSGIITDDTARGPGVDGIYRVDVTDYRLDDGQSTLVVPFVWEGDDGLVVIKRYVFERDSYLIRVEHEVQNGSERDLRASQQVYLRRSSEVDDGTSWFIYTYSGGVINTPDRRYSKISFSDMASKPIDQNVRDGWLAMIQHYFIGAIVPPPGEERRYWSRGVGNNVFDMGMNTFWRSVPSGGSAEFETRLYVGPKEQHRLAEVAPHLQLTVDFGWLTIISSPLFIAMNWIYSVVGNWGLAIIFITLAIKLVFYKLSETSYRSMARMRKMQPKMQALKERFGDDRTALNQALMKMYKEEKINPLGGCLPILIQIPVFIALYWVLLESVELRHAPFMLWIQDLSTPDPFFVLPLLMGLTMFIQQKLNPAPLDPIQQKVMMVLPVAFTIFFMFFPAGLVLYWVVNNTLSIAQQWVITRRIESGAEK